MKRDQYLGLSGAFLFGLACVPLLAWMTGVQKVFQVEPQGGQLPALDIPLGFLWRAPGANGPAVEIATVWLPVTLLIAAVAVTFLGAMVRRIGYAAVGVLAIGVAAWFYLQFDAVLAKAAAQEGSGVAGGALGHLGPGYWCFLLAAVALIVGAVLGEGRSAEADADSFVAADSDESNGRRSFSLGRRKKSGKTDAATTPIVPTPVSVASPAATAAGSWDGSASTAQSGSWASDDAAHRGYGTEYGTGYDQTQYGTAYDQTQYGTAYDQTQYGTAYDQTQYGTGYDQTQYGSGYDQTSGTESGQDYAGYGQAQYGYDVHGAGAYDGSDTSGHAPAYDGDGYGANGGDQWYEPNAGYANPTSDDGSYGQS